MAGMLNVRVLAVDKAHQRFTLRRKIVERLAHGESLEKPFGIGTVVDIGTCLNRRIAAHFCEITVPQTETPHLRE